MLLAYLDEIGETGAFISRDHPRFNTSPAFGYAGFVIPEQHARAVGSHFQSRKLELFPSETARAEHPGRWERKGAAIFRADTPTRYPAQLRAFNGLVHSLRRLDASAFYYAEEKPLGTPKQTRLEADEREIRAMRETLNRLARYAEHHDQNLLVMIDQVNEKSRAARLPRMYGHILGRAADHPR